MDRNRILTLALENLERQLTEFETAIEQLRELKGEIRQAATKKPGTPILVAVKRMSKTRAERRAQSLRTKAYRAAQADRRTSKRRPKSDAEKKP